VVIGQQIILTTADEARQSQMVMAFDLATGKENWRTEVLQGQLPERIHAKNTHASPTVASDGRQVFALFLNGENIVLACLDLKGAKLWQIKTGEFHSRYPYGFAASPTIYGELVIVSSEFENQGGGYLAAFRKSDGSEVWRVPRTAGTSYSSPIVARVAGRDQLLISGQAKVSSYDPATGKVIWQAAGSSPATCGTMVWSEDTVFASGGYPNKETIAVLADGSGKILWRNDVKAYEQSMLFHDGHLYALDDGGIAYCWNGRTGEEKWKVRLGGPVSASPVLADGKIFAMNEQGITFVFKADPSAYREVARNHLGESGFATPAFVDDSILIRAAWHRPGGREEWLFRISD